MVNTNAPFGLRPVRHLFGGEMRLSEYNIADQYGTALYLGDPVVCTGTGRNIGIASAATSGKLTGVFAGCEYVDAVGNTQFSKFWPAATVTQTVQAVKAFVYDDPFILYAIQFNTLAIGDVRALANLVSGAGNAQTGLSGWTAIAPPGAGENQLKIYSVPTGEIQMNGNINAYGAFAIAHVLLAQHELAGNMANL